MDKVKQRQVEKFEELLQYGTRSKHYMGECYLDVYGNPCFYNTYNIINEDAVRRVLKMYMFYYCDLRIIPSSIYVIGNGDGVKSITFARQSDFDLACIFFRKAPHFEVICIDKEEKVLAIRHCTE